MMGIVMKMHNMQLKDSLILFSIIMVLIGILAFAFNFNLKTAEEKRQSFENSLLEKVIVGNNVDNNASKTIIHNQGVIISNDAIKNHNEEIIIHNQMQFAKFGMNGTPDIHTDFQRTSTDYWQNYTH